MSEKYGEWIAIDNDPEEEGTYLVAWLPKGLKRAQCFVGLVNYYKEFGWDEEDIKWILEQSLFKDEVELYAWMPLPEMYKVDWEN